MLTHNTKSEKNRINRHLNSKINRSENNYEKPLKS